MGRESYSFNLQALQGEPKLYFCFVTDVATKATPEEKLPVIFLRELESL